MNFLAHLSLSGNNEDVMVGNFIADGVKGKKYNNYSGGIKAGILLHRFIDDFTDNHPIVLESKKRLWSVYGKFSGIIIDVFYDYYLSENWHNYYDIELKLFINNAYRVLNDNMNQVPEKYKQIIPIMKQQDWLTSYQSISGINKILIQMANRIVHESKLELAHQSLKEFHEEFNCEFKLFFPELIKASNSKLTDLING